MSERIIAIGDIHGCATALSALLDAVQPTALDTIIPLGDYIDCGPDSRGVLDQLIQLKCRCLLIPLLGNHEEMLLNAIDRGLEFRFWLDCGGKQTLASYGAGEDVKRIPAEHLEFIRGCRDFFETEGHIFMHAYYEPHLRCLAEQPWKGLRWSSLPREPKPHCSGKIAIVGHTAQASGEVLDHGFLQCIDTRCFGGRWLTALEVNSGQIWQANQQGELRRPPPLQR